MDDTLTRTVVCGLETPVSVITPAAPLTSLALTKEGVLLLCADDTGLAVNLTAAELRWLSQMTAIYAERLDMEAVTTFHHGQKAGHA